MTLTDYTTVPPRRPGSSIPATHDHADHPTILVERTALAGPGDLADKRSRIRERLSPTFSAGSLTGLLVLGVCLAAVARGAVVGELTTDGALTLTVFCVAIWCWIFAPVDDTYIALGAALVLVLAGPMPAATFTETLGHEVIWLLIGAFVIAAAVSSTGLTRRFADAVIGAARTPRQLVHLSTVALIVSVFAIPSTSGRAALALPIFSGLASRLPGRPAVLRALALIFPTVIVLSAVGSLLGAGAHLITAEMVRTATGRDLGFITWMMLGLPLAVLWSHLAAEIALLGFTDRGERRRRLPVAASGVPKPGLDTGQKRMLVLLAVIIAAWCTEPVHGLSPAIVAMIGAVVATAPAMRAGSLGPAVKNIPWNLLLFMAATFALGISLIESGAAEWVAGHVFDRVDLFGDHAGLVFIGIVVVVSLGAHLLMQSRSARSAVLVPLVLAAAPAVGIDPAAAAFLSTAAAGFCLTLTSSAKPIAMFAHDPDSSPHDLGVGGHGYRPRDLLRLSGVLAPVSVALLAGFALLVWPIFGLSLFAHT